METTINANRQLYTCTENGKTNFVARITPKGCKLSIVLPESINYEVNVDNTKKLTEMFRNHRRDLQLGIMTYNEAVRLTMDRHPICKAIEGSEFAKKYDIKPWHHLHFFGNFMALVIWDTRLITNAINVSKLTDADFAQMKYEYSDNMKPIHVDYDNEPPYSGLLKLASTMPTSIKEHQRNLIQK
jgi:hypothetical protein